MECGSFQSFVFNDVVSLLSATIELRSRHPPISSIQVGFQTADDFDLLFFPHF